MKYRVIIFALCFLFLTFQLLAADTWVKTYQPFGDGDYYIEDVVVCDDGDFAVNGFYYYFDDWTEVQWGYLMKTDSLGNFLWAKKDTVSWIDDTESSAFVQTDDGGFLSAVYSLWGGTALIKRDSEGNREWVVDGQDLYIHSMDMTHDGNIILAGRMNGLPAMRKITQNNEILWEDTYYLSGSGNGSVQSISKTSDEGFIATGYTSGNGFDIFALKVNSIGDSLWSRTFDGYGNFDEGFCVIENVYKEIYISGYFGLSNNTYGILIKLNANSDIIFILNEFSSDNDYAFRSMVDNSSNIIGYGRGNLYAYSYDGDSLWVSNLNGNSGRGDKCLGINNNHFICAGEYEMNWDDYIMLTKTDCTGQVAVDENNQIIPTDIINIHNSPNPFDQGTTISFNLDKSSRVTLDIFNIKGQLVKSLDVNTKSGLGNITWDGRDSSGKVTKNGVYFYKLTADKKEVVKKMVLMR